ncbi:MULTISPECIES: hypothetical protein [Gluconobacter]|uniref:Lipoprotein n=1 Tax=Gluconobacter cadivus TaxID=2728101 RepID=A0ABR9YXJ0_9PROT|nr:MULTISPECIES: hypothetical protein [Gluconobacter]MBF0888918.1 hypothetical protein [Gluconobacter cadivus]MBS1060264.1 hypothetical protein [Gluconobacter sp. Dm-44]
MLKLDKIVIVFFCFSLGGCYSIGSQRLGKDQDEYSVSIIESNKRQTLQNLIRLRYADTPGLLDTTQLISGYQFQQNAFLGVASDTFPIRPNGGVSTQLQQNPTFTFQPVTGDAYAHSFLSPLSPASLLPLAMGGLPIDILLQLSAQSINSMSNNRPFSRRNGDVDNNTIYNTDEFFELIHDLRLLQASGLLEIQLQQFPKFKGKPSGASHVFLNIYPTSNPNLEKITQITKKLLNFSPNYKRMEVVYGSGTPNPGEINILSRSMLSILGQVAYQINIPEDEFSAGGTSMDLDYEEKPLIKIKYGRKKIENSFVSIYYDKYYYWIDRKDFKSKLAFTITQMLLELSKTTQPPGAIVTIPVTK